MSQRTVQDLLDRVRQVLQDTDKDNYRYPQTDLVGTLNDAVLEARRLRPDIFVGKFRVSLPQVPMPDLSNPAVPDYTVVAFPLPDWAFLATVNLVAGRTEIRDDEFADDGRAATFIGSFAQTLMGGQ